MSRTTNYPNSRETTSERVPKRFRTHVRHFLGTLDKLNTDFEVRCTLHQAGEPRPLSAVYTEEGYQEVPLTPLTDATATLPPTESSETMGVLAPVTAGRPQPRDPYSFDQGFGSEPDTHWEPAPVSGSVALPTDEPDLTLEGRSPLDSPATAWDYPSLVESPASQRLALLSDDDRDSSISTILRQMGMAYPQSLNPADDSQPADPLIPFAVQTPTDQRTETGSEQAAPIATGQGEEQQAETQLTETQLTETQHTGTQLTETQHTGTQLIETAIAETRPSDAPSPTTNHQPDQAEQPSLVLLPAEQPNLDSLPLAAIAQDGVSQSETGPTHDVTLAAQRAATDAEVSVVVSEATVRTDQASVVVRDSTEESTAASVGKQGATADSETLSVVKQTVAVESTAASAVFSASTVEPDEPSVVVSGLTAEPDEPSVVVSDATAESTVAIADSSTTDIAFERQNGTKLVNVGPKSEVLVSGPSPLPVNQSQNVTKLVNVVPKMTLLAPSAATIVVFSETAVEPDAAIVVVSGSAVEPVDASVSTKTTGSEPNSTPQDAALTLATLPLVSKAPTLDHLPPDQEVSLVPLSAVAATVSAGINELSAIEREDSVSSNERSAIERESLPDAQVVSSMAAVPTDRSLTLPIESMVSLTEALPPDPLPVECASGSDQLSEAESHSLLPLLVAHSPQPLPVASLTTQPQETNPTSYPTHPEVNTDQVQAECQLTSAPTHPEVNTDQVQAASLTDSQPPLTRLELENGRLALTQALLPDAITFPPDPTNGSQASGQAEPTEPTEARQLLPLSEPPCSLLSLPVASLTDSAAIAKSVATESLAALPESPPDGLESPSEAAADRPVEPGQTSAFVLPVTATAAPIARLTLPSECLPNSAFVLATELLPAVLESPAERLHSAPLDGLDSPSEPADAPLPEGLESPSDPLNEGQPETLDSPSSLLEQAGVFGHSPSLLVGESHPALVPSDGVSLPVEDDRAETVLPASEPRVETLNGLTLPSESVPNRELELPANSVSLPAEDEVVASAAASLEPLQPDCFVRGSEPVGKGQPLVVSHETVASVLPDSPAETSDRTTDSAQTSDCLKTELPAIERDCLSTELATFEPLTLEPEPLALDSLPLSVSEPLAGAAPTMADTPSPATVETPDQGFAEELFVVWRRLALNQSQTVWGVVVSLEDIFTQGFGTWFAPRFIGSLAAAEGVVVTWGCAVQLVEDNPLCPDQERYVLGGKSVVGVTFPNPSVRVLTLEPSGSASSLKPFAQAALTAGFAAKSEDAALSQGRRATVLLEEPTRPELEPPLPAAPLAHPPQVLSDPEEEVEEEAAPVRPKPGSLWRAGLRMLLGK